jgi:hypothetical protein
VTVRPLTPGETKLFQDLRLRVLADAPDAFAHTHSEIYARMGFSRTGRCDHLPVNFHGVNVRNAINRGRLVHER